jgi:hypothetical protein
MISLNIGFLPVLYFLFIRITDCAGPIKNFPKLINWRDGVVDEANYIETEFSDVIDDQESIIYWAGRNKYFKNRYEIKTINLGADGTIVWKLCDTVDINMMGMDVVDSIDTNLVKKANKKDSPKYAVSLILIS